MMEFLLNCIGFFLQFGPVCLLCTLAFDQDFFRIKKSIYLAVMMGGSVLSSVLFACFMENSAITDLFGSDSSFGNIYLSVIAIAVIVLYFLFVKASVIAKMVNLVLIMFYAISQYMLVNLLIPLFPETDFENVYPLGTVLLYFATTVVLMPVMMYLLRFPVREYLANIPKEHIRKEFKKVLITSVVYFILLILYIAVIPEVSSFDSVVYAMLMLPILSMNTISLLVFFVSIFRESMRHERDMEYNGYLEIQRTEYRKITQELENTRRIRHDMRHHLATIYELAEAEMYDKQKAYIEALLSVSTKSVSVQYCENASINALLQYYITQANDAGVKCTVIANCGEIPIPQMDITVMLGNTLENAVRSCINATGRKFLDVNIGMVGSTLAISVTNSCDEIHPSGKYKLDNSNYFPAEAFISSRSTGGIGLKSVSTTARTYGGDAQFRYDDENQSFSTRIRLNTNPEN